MPTAQARSIRIFGNVVNDSIEFVFASHEMVVILALPKSAGTLQNPSGSGRGERLPPVQYFRQSVTVKDSKQRMHMVRHHAPCIHPVFRQIEVPQRFGDNPTISRKHWPAPAFKFDRIFSLGRLSSEGRPAGLATARKL